MKKTIDYTKIEWSDLRTELITYLQNTNTFKDVNIEGSNIKSFVDIFAYIGQLFGFYIYASANELFLPTAKIYGNLVKISELLRYEARGVTSANVDVYGALNPEYAISKNGQSIEIPTYSIFPSTRQSSTGQNIQFTNVEPINYVIKSYGVRIVDEPDFSYNGYSLPLTAPAAFFSATGSISGSSDVQLNATGFSLPLTKYKQLRIINENDPTNYRGYDTTEYPLSNGTSVQGQPFEQTVNAISYSTPLLPNTLFYLVFNYSTNTSEPYLSLTTDPSILNTRTDDVMCSLQLVPTDDTNTFYTLETVDIFSFHRFYLGTLGLFNLESVELDFTTMPNRPQSLQLLSMVVNKDGTKPAFGVLIDGVYYNFTSGTINSQTIAPDSFDLSVASYNVNLCLDAPDSPSTNYGARLEITTNDPIQFQATVATIFTQFQDPTTQTPTVTSFNGNRFGDITVAQSIQTDTTNQKNGIVSFDGTFENTAVIFNTAFSNSDYQITLGATQNIRKWYANQNINGFTIYIEPGSNFVGDIAWVATETIQNNLTEMQVFFDKPIPQVIENNALVSNYMVMLTPSDNIEVWYENLTSTGFTINTSRNYLGKVSWSVYNYLATEFTPSENVQQSYLQTGKVVLHDFPTYDVTLETQVNDENYSVQLTPNNDVIVWYTNKSSTGFTINVDPTALTSDITINWSVDSSTTDYIYQAHGEVQFSGQTTLNSFIPGLSFIPLPETFTISNLYEGIPQISNIDSNLVVDTASNSLQLALDPHRVYVNEVKFIIGNTAISSNTIRVFVQNTQNNWDEWSRAGFAYNQTANIGEQVFKVTMNSDSLLCIEFGDGVLWGTSIQDSEVVIFGLQSVGSNGNIINGSLSPTVTLSQYILGNDITSVGFEQNLIDLIGLKSQLTFAGNSVSTSIIDSEGTQLQPTDLTIFQDQNAFGGNDIETSDELRQNATNFYVTQNRLVALDDYSRYITTTYSDYLIKTQVYSYQDAATYGLIPNNAPVNYWFNYIFIVGLNADGSNSISKNLHDYIVNGLNSSKFRMQGAAHELVPATWVPIDIAIRYVKASGGSAQTIETQMKANLANYFSNYTNLCLGQEIYHSTIASLINVDNVKTFEVMLNKNPGNTLQANDYSVNFTAQDTDVNIARRNKLMELVAINPSLVKIFQPLFDTINVDGSVNWNYSLNVQLAKFEFPQLGNIIIEQATS